MAVYETWTCKNYIVLGRDDERLRFSYFLHFDMLLSRAVYAVTCSSIAEDYRRVHAVHSLSKNMSLALTSKVKGPCTFQVYAPDFQLLANTSISSLCSKHHAPSILRCLHCLRDNVGQVTQNKAVALSRPQHSNQPFRDLAPLIHYFLDNKFFSLLLTVSLFLNQEFSSAQRASQTSTIISTCRQEYCNITTSISQKTSIQHSRWANPIMLRSSTPTRFSRSW